MLQAVKNKMALRKVLEKELKEFIKKSGINDPMHGLSHVLSVWGNTKRLATKGADIGILAAAVFLHDLGRFDKRTMAKSRGAASAEHAKKILAKIGFPKKKIGHVLEAIKCHDTICPLSKRRTKEARLLFDADKLDVFGPYGIARHLSHQALCGFSLKETVKDGIKSAGMH